MCLEMFAVGLIGVIYGGIIAPGPPESSRHDDTLELGPTVSGLALQSLYAQDACGYGVKLSYPWSDYALLEGEYAHYLNASEEHTHSLFLTGVRVGIRKRKVGAFVKLQPGMFRAVENPRSDPSAFSKFAFSAGGVLEVHLGSRIYMRFDSGYLIIWLGDTTFAGVPSVRPGTSKYYQASVGFGFRF